MVILVAGSAGLNVSGGSIDELVTEATYGEQVPRVVLVVFELAAQPFHVDVERPRVAEVVGSPHFVDQELAREQATTAPQERLEQLELLRRQRDRFAADGHLVPADVHAHRTARDDLVD